MQTKHLGGMIGSLTLLVFSTVLQAQPQRDDVLIVPARARMVRLAFDLQALRGPTLVSYRLTDDPLQPLLHVWNRNRKMWQEVPAEALSLAPAMPVMPNRVYVIGRSTEIPEVIPVALSQAREVRMLDTLSIAEILTSLDREMQFSFEEWKTLAERHNLEMTEVNREQRRWGRFGPPRRYRQSPPPDQPSAGDSAPGGTPPASPSPALAAPEATPVDDAMPADVPPAIPATETEVVQPQPDAEAENLPETVSDDLLEYEPAPLDPEPSPDAEETTPELEKGAPLPAAQDAAASDNLDQEFPIK